MHRVMMLAPRSHSHIHHVYVIIDMDFISIVLCHKKNAPNPLVSSIIRSASCGHLPKLRNNVSMPSTQKPSPHCWCLLIRPCPKCLNSHLHQTTSNYNNHPQAASRCLRVHTVVYQPTRKPSTLWLTPTNIMATSAGLTKSPPNIPRCPSASNPRQTVLEITCSTCYVPCDARN